MPGSSESRFERTTSQTSHARKLRRDVSKAEFKIWPYLRGRQLGVKFRRQHPIGPYFADYYCAQLKLAIEVDGDWHDPLKDKRRDQFFARREIQVHRIPVPAIDENIEGVIEGITYVIAERKLDIKTPQ